MTAVNGKREIESELARTVPRRARRIEAFHPSYRRFIRDLTSCSSELEDLADSFPALLFALATGYATPQQRERAFELVCAGAPLREAADGLGLPWWLRRLPAQAFAFPLPAFPTDADFALRISSVIPIDADVASAWLARVAHAYEACSAPYALWVARQSDLAGAPQELLVLLAAWVWFSGRPGQLGNRLLRRPWTSDLSLRRAREELGAWRQRLRLIECLGLGIETPWLADGSALGFDFVALRTVDDFIAESEALDNCLDQYADQLHTGGTAVFSIRKGGRRVACVEIGLHEEEVSMPTIVQLRATRNRRAAPEIWQATFGWLGGQRLEALPPAPHRASQPARSAARRQLWRPYLTFLEGTQHLQAFRSTMLQRDKASRGARQRLYRGGVAVIRTGAPLRRQQPAADTTVPPALTNLAPVRT